MFGVWCKMIYQYIKEVIMPSGEQIDRLFEAYKANMDRSAELENMPFSAKDRDSLLCALKKRSAGLRDMLRENAEAIARLKEAEREPDAQTARAFLDNINNMGVDRYDDPSFMLELINGLLPYYEAQGDRDACILLYNRRGWETTAMLRLGGSVEDYPAVERYLDILKYKDQYAEIADINVRSKILVAYYNIAVVMPTMDIISIEDSYRYYSEMAGFYNSDIVQRLDGENTHLRELVERARVGWLAVESRVHAMSEDMKLIFAEVAEEAYRVEERRAKDAGDEINADVFLAYIHARVLRHELDWNQAIDLVLKYYYVRLNRIDRQREADKAEFDIDEEFYLRTRIPDALIYQWLDEDSVEPELRITCRRALIQDKMDYLASIPTNVYSPFLNQTFAKWGFGSFSYLDTPAEKEAHLINLVVRRHINTYIHSLMVQRLADRLTAEAFEDDPSRFVGVLGCADTKNVVDNRAKIEEFIHACTIFHDIGKNQIAGIINIQTRKLNNDEFAIIKQHPDVGAEVLENDSDFARYFDVIRGHHKFYDGSGGYPADFDNTASPVRFVIDIVTICDCIDAATDTLGRNYAGGKDFLSVLEELKAGSGERYNPYLVGLIASTPSLIADMSAMVSTGREDVYAYVYQRYADPLIN